MITAAFILGWCFGGMSMMMMVPAMFALWIGEQHEAMAFMNAAVGLFVLAGVLIFALHKDHLSLGRRQQLLIVIGLWILLPAGAGIPFYVGGSLPTISQAYFEAVSGFTTTGATLFKSLTGVPQSVILWRSLIQWMGGLTTLLTVSFIVGRLLGDELFGKDASSIIQSSSGGSRDLQNAVTEILPVYAGLTLLCYALLVLAGIPMFDALCLSLSTLSTGGYMPRDGSIALYGSPAAELTLTIFMFLGAVSIIWVKALVRRNKPILARNYEPLGIGIVILVLGLVFAVSLLTRSPSRDVFSFVHGLTLGFASAASLISTTGFVFGNEGEITMPYFLLFAIALVGGGSYSTAGGIKFSRLATMLDLSRRELTRLLYPHSVGKRRHGSEVRDANVRRSVWSIFAVTVVTLVVMVLILSYHGVPPAAALLAAISSMSNFGPAYDMARSTSGPGFPPMFEMTRNAHLFLGFGMVVGRLETLMLLGLFNIALWRK